MPSWREQYDRMKRWQNRLWIDPIMFGPDAMDTFYAFAQACFHFVDWLENDRSQHVRRVQAETFVNTDPVLAFCRDICNGSKHAQLGPRKVKVKSQTTTDSYQIEDETGHPVEYVVEKTEVLVDCGGQFFNVEDYAAVCVASWDGFLREQGLAASPA